MDIVEGDIHSAGKTVRTFSFGIKCALIGICCGAGIRLEHRRHASPQPFTTYLPQVPALPRIKQGVDGVVQSPIDISQCAWQTVGCDDSIKVSHECGAALRDDRLQAIAHGVVGFECIMDGLRGRIVTGRVAESAKQVKRTYPPPINGVIIHVLGHDHRPLSDVIFGGLKPGGIGHNAKPSSSAASVGTGSSHQRSSRFSLVVSERISALSMYSSPLR